MSKTILNCQDLSNQVQLVMKIRKVNDLTNHIGLAYTKNDIELSRPIRLGVVYDETRSSKCNLCRKRNKVIMTDHTRCGLWQKLDRTTT